jgi:sirohydrochlorin ferrochelatase
MTHSTETGPAKADAETAEAAYIVFAHGSSVESANDAVRVVARQAADRGDWRTFAAAFLEGGRPSLADAVDELAAHGTSHFVVIPYFLTLGLHLQRDLPRLIEEIKRKHPAVEIEVTAPLDGHPSMAEALVDRAKDSQRRLG